MRQIIQLFAAAASFVLFSCKPSVDYTAELKATDSIKKELETAAVDFSRIDSNEVNEARLTIDAYLKFVTANIKDTIQRDDALMLSELKNVNKALGKYVRTRKDLKKYYRHNIKQLDDLAYDLQKNNIENRDSAKYFILTEKEANAQLISAMKMHLNVIPAQLKKFDSLKPIAENFINKINNGTIPPDLLKSGELENEAEEDD
jgi:hypothetical protein